MPLKGMTIKLVQSVPEGEICELQPTFVLVKEEIKVREEAPKIPAKVWEEHTILVANCLEAILPVVWCS